mgnify:CR=1 FL=1
MSKRQLPPDRVSSYFRAESGVLAVITVTGLLYNIGLVAGPWFEGQMTEALARILLGGGSFSTMVSLAAGYIAVVAAVQGLRFLKRFYVRRFANKVNRRMKRVLYGALVRSDRGDLEREGAGTVLTKAISDVDDCAEGMRKFTTEIFDTGVALVGYAVMLFVYDWRLALLCMIFTPVSYICAEWMKKPVQRAGAAYKKAAGALNAATLDRAQNAVKLAARHAIADKIDRLVFDPALFEPALGLFRVEALIRSKNLDVHLTPPASRPPRPWYRRKRGTPLLPKRPQYDL